MTLRRSRQTDAILASAAHSGELKQVIYFRGMKGFDHEKNDDIEWIQNISIIGENLFFGDR
jgi:hypothetical protein